MTILLQGAGIQTAAAAPVPPLFVSAEVGTVNASTVAVTFDQDVSASGSDYSSGVTIKVNGSTRAFESGIRQANHAIVYYALSLAVVNGDTVTWEYAETSGNIVAEDDSTPLEDVTAQSVTNNVSAGDPIGDGLRADALAYWTMNEVSGTRADSKTTYPLIESNGLDNSPAAPGSVGSSIGKIGRCVTTVDDPNNPLILYNGSLGIVTRLGIDVLTIAGWMKCNDWSSDFFGLQSSDPFFMVGTGIYIELPITITDHIAIETSEAGDYKVTASYHDAAEIGISKNTWYFFVFEDNGTNQTFRINNSAPVSISSATLWQTDITWNSIIVGEPNFNDTLDAIYTDELGVWIRALTSDERDYLYNSGAGRSLYP